MTAVLRYVSTASWGTRNERPTRIAGISPEWTSRYTVILETRMISATSATVRKRERNGPPSLTIVLHPHWWPGKPARPAVGWCRIASCVPRSEHTVGVVVAGVKGGEPGALCPVPPHQPGVTSGRPPRACRSVEDRHDAEGRKGRRKGGYHRGGGALASRRRPRRRGRAGSTVPRRASRGPPARSRRRRRIPRRARRHA